MHEFSIVQNIIEIVIETAAAHDVDHITSVEVEVGKASGVVREAMEFAWEAGIKGTIIHGAVLKIKEIPLVVKCNVCKRQYEPAEIYDTCPGCGEVYPEIISGKELRVMAIET